jgi:hypothetical protein
MPNDFQNIGKEIPTQTAPVVLKSAAINDIIRTVTIANLPSVKQPNTNPYQGKPQVFTKDPGLYLSPLGTPVMQDITFKSVTYTDFITNQVRTTQDLKLINFLLTVTQAKKIIKTEIQGRDGTVKEYIGLDDYSISINGTIIGDNGNHPADQLIALKNTIKARVSIPVVNTYLNNLDINTITIEEVTFEQEAGGYSKIPFSITALSDADVTLVIL